MSTPTLDRFLGEANSILERGDGEKLREYLILEPPYPDIYLGMIRELNQNYPAGKEKQLEDKVDQLLPDSDLETCAWTGFRSFLVSWLRFICNVDVKNILKTYHDLVFLMRQCQIALGHTNLGYLILPTTLFYAHTLAKFTIYLENQPDLLVEAQQQMRDESAGGGDEEGQDTLAATTARVIIEALKKCINDRTGFSNGGLAANGKPAGRKIGIYVLANISLKLLTRARQFRVAETIFTPIQQLSPPLSRFPASHRVTYLYYLGRYHFSNNHFLRASAALQAAYDQTRTNDYRQRYTILIHLIAANMVVGKFPSQELLSRPEAKPLAPHFTALTKALRAGDLPSFRRLTSFDEIGVAGSTARFLLVHGLLIQLRNRCDVLVLRSLARRAFKEAGFHGSEGSKAAPNMDIAVLRAVIVRLEAQATTLAKEASTEHFDLDEYIDPDFEGLDEEDLNYLPYAVYDEDVDEITAVNNSTSGGDVNGSSPSSRESPTLPEVELLVASLLRQGLLHGFLSHKHAKFVVSGARNKDPVSAGFPRVWDVMSTNREKEVVGWVTDSNRGQRIQGGVVRLSGAEPVGIA